MKQLLVRLIALIAIVGVGVALNGIAADEQNWGIYQFKDRRSGYTYASIETRAMQDDEFENPGYIWVDKGSELWERPDGATGKACTDCHADATKSMLDVGARYPVYAPELDKLINTEHRINQCRTERMAARAWPWESESLLAMTAFVKNQSKDIPVSPIIDGPAAEFFEAGKAFYLQRRGQLDMACIHCHEMNHGNMLRAQRLSQGMANGFPLYRLKWQSLGSLQRRIRRCNEQVRAKPYALGADEYVNLELYLAWRARGLPVETPAVRN